jgi:hypothetical protein
MDLDGRRKAQLFHTVLSALKEHFTLVPMGEHARAILAHRTPALREPALAT